jgi:hypothetical protein
VQSARTFFWQISVYANSHKKCFGISSNMLSDSGLGHVERAKSDRLGIDVTSDIFSYTHGMMNYYACVGNVVKIVLIEVISKSMIYS